MSVLRLLAPPIVLLAWAGVWALGVTGNGVIVIALVVLAVACVVAEIERQRLRRGMR